MNFILQICQLIFSSTNTFFLLLIYFSLFQEFSWFAWPWWPGLAPTEATEKTVRDCMDPFHPMTEGEFLSCYRLYKKATQDLIKRVHLHLPQAESNRGKGQLVLWWETYVYKLYVCVYLRSWSIQGLSHTHVILSLYLYLSRLSLIWRPYFVAIRSSSSPFQVSTLVWGKLYFFCYSDIFPFVVFFVSSQLSILSFPCQL